MVGKKIANPDRGSSKSSRITKLCNYIAEPSRTLDYLSEHQKNRTIEKCTYLGGRGFFSESIRGRAKEMVSLAEEAVKSPDPVTHYMLSWQQDERPTPKQIEEAVSIFAKELGVEDHMMIYGFHEDTHNGHLHIAINRVHPETFKVSHIGGGFDIELVHKAIARIEHVQGWKREKNGRYIINEKGKAVKANKEAIKDKNSPLKPSQRAIDKEHETGTKSAERIAIERAGPVLEKATSWQEVHRELAKSGMRYERYGSGAVIFVGDEPVKASVASRKASINQMQKRLGPFEHKGESNVYFEHRPAREKPYPDHTRSLSEHNMRKLSECSLAPDRQAGKQKPARVLSFVSCPRGRADEAVRRDDNLPVRLAPEPLHPGDPILAAYVAERELYRAKKKAEQEALKAKHQAEREELKRQQTTRRNKIMEGSWVGKGTKRNAVASVLAAEQAAEREELKEKQRLARLHLAEIMPPFPGYEEWLRRQGMEAEAEAWRQKNQDYLKQQEEKEKVNSFSGPSGLEYAPPRPPHDIRAFESYPTVNDEVAYVRRGAPDNANPAFTDIGNQIEMHDTQPDSTLAAMQLAREKWGSVHVDGSEEFKSECIKLAVQNGIEISNPELQEQVELERRRLAIAQNAPVPELEEGWDIRAESQAQAHDDMPPPGSGQEDHGQDRDQAKDQVAELEKQRLALLGEIDALAKLEMPVMERIERTRAISEKITLVDAQLDRLAPSEAPAPAKPEPAPEPQRQPQTAADWERERERLVKQMDTLATQEMPFNDRLDRTRDLTAKITDAERMQQQAAEREAKAEQQRQAEIAFAAKILQNGQQFKGTLGNQLYEFKGKQYIGLSDGKTERYIAYDPSMNGSIGKQVDVQNDGTNISFMQTAAQNNAISKPQQSKDGNSLQNNGLSHKKVPSM